MPTNPPQRIIIPSLLALATVYVMVFQLTQANPIALGQWLPEIGVFGLLSALALIFSVSIALNEFSLAHAVGIIAFFSPAAEAFPWMVSAVGVGTIGGTALGLRLRNDRSERDLWEIARATAVLGGGLTLTFAASGMLYQAVFDGGLPLASSAAMSENGIAVVGYMLSYAVGYVSSTLLFLWYIGLNIQRYLEERWLNVLLLTIFPVPFAITGASVAQRTDSFFFFIITIAGFVLTIFGAYVLNLSQQQLRRQIQDNQVLLDQNRTRAEQLANLSQVTTVLTGSLSLDEVLDTIVVSATVVTNADGVIVFISDMSDKAERWVIVRESGLKVSLTGSDFSPLHEQPFVDSQDLEPLIVDLSASRPFEISGNAALNEAGPFQTILEIPFVTGEARLGYLTLVFDAPPTAITNITDISSAFATQAALAISNARAFTRTDLALNRRMEQLYVLADMGHMLNAELQIWRIYEISLRYAIQTTAANYGALMMVSDESNWQAVSLHRISSVALDDETRRKQLDDALQAGMPQYFPAISQADNYVPLVPTVQSALLAPLSRGEYVCGVLVLESDHPDAFQEGDRNFLHQLVNQATIALDNAQLFQRVRESRDNQQAILNAIEEGLLLLDSWGQIVLTNPRIDLLGLTEEALLAHNIRTLADDESNGALIKRLGFDNPQQLHDLVDAVQQGTLSERSEQYEVSNEAFGLRYIERRVIPLIDERQNVLGALLVFYNKTEEHELERSRESFTQMIVHDLRSPLTAVTTSLHLLQELVPKDTPFYPAVDKTTHNSQRAIRKVLSRVDSLLDIARMESGEMLLEREPSSAPYLIQNVQTELAPLAAQLDVVIKRETPPDLPLLDVDADKVERMLLNLVDNALKYTEMNSEVIVRAEPTDDGEMVRFSVADRGPGIPEAYKRTLFDRFVQVEGRKVMRRGVGLGLTFCKLVAETHGGQIWIEDHEGGGSVFNVTLPISRIEALPD